MKYLTLILLSTIILFSCESADKSATETTEETRTEATEEKAQVEFEKFGKEITAEGALEASEIANKLASKDSVFAKINSKVSQVCKKKGCWMMVSLDEETEMRVRFKDYEFFVPLNCEGKNVVIEGWAYKYETSVEELKHYALDGGSSLEEIDAITEPEIGYTFMADGVLMN